MAADGASFTGAVLAGGASSRMGRDKALIDLDGRPLVAAAAEALSGAGAGSVMVIGGDGAALAALGLDARPDDHPGEGPLGGILTALRLSADPIVMILACDMPAIDAATVAAIVAALAGTPGADVAVAVVEGRRQLLTAAYRRRTDGALRRAFDAGERAPRRAVQGLEVIEVPGLDPHLLGDVDRPDDLRRYAQRHA